MTPDSIGLNPPAVVRRARRSPDECADVANKRFQYGEAAYLEVGLALVEAVEQIPHGQKKEWIQKHFKGSYRTAARLMRSAKVPRMALLGDATDCILEPMDEDSYFASIENGTTCDAVAQHEPVVPLPPVLVQQSLLPPVMQLPLLPPKPTGPVLCHACSHRKQLGRPLVENCEDCKAARAAAKTSPGQPATGSEPGANASAPESLSAAGDAQPDAVVSYSDAAETVPEGVVCDPEGRAYPPEAVPLLEDTSVAELAGEVGAVMRRLEEVTATPAGAFLHKDPLRKQLNAVKLQINCHRLDKKNAFRCDECKGAGCAKCKELGIVPKPLYGEKA